MKNPIILGKFGATHGIHGWIKVYSFTDPAENLKEYPTWLIKYKNQWQPITLDGRKMQGHTLVVKIKGIDSPEEARRYTNCFVGVKPQDLPKLAPGEYYWSDLTDLTVITTDGKRLGKITSLFSTGANDVMVIKSEDNTEHLLPYIKSVVKSVDLDKGEMQVDWEIMDDA